MQIKIPKILKKFIYIKGINEAFFKKSLNTLGVNQRISFLFIREKKRIKFNILLKFFDKFIVLQKHSVKFKKFLIKIYTYRGFRHKKKLPVRGQRTHTNAQTIKRVSY